MNRKGKIKMKNQKGSEKKKINLHEFGEEGLFWMDEREKVVRAEY